MRRTLTALFITAVIGAPAFAADLPIRPAPRFERPAPIVEQTAYNWTGFYIGGHAGWTWAKETETYSDKNVDFSQTIKMDNWLVGGHLIAQVQHGPIVVGLKVSGSWMDDLEGSLTASECVWHKYGECKKTFTTIDRPRFTMLTTAEARLGYAMDRTLVYLAGGGAFGLAELSHDEWYDSKYHGVSGKKNIFSEQMFGGYVVSAGFEYALSQKWMFGFEYSYVGLQSIETKISSPRSQYEETAQLHLAKVFLNYRF